MEITGSGYARSTVANTSTVWGTADGGEKTTGVLTLSGSGEFDTPAIHWCLFDGTTGWFTGEFDEPVMQATDTVCLSVYIGDGE